jgi:hypothetical protein
MAGYVIYGRSVLVGVVLLSLAACGKLGAGGGDDQMGWARAALERNNRLEVVASDPQTSTFTVRMKDSGELRMIRVDQIVGDPGAAVAGEGTAAPVSTPSSEPGAAPANSQPAPAPSEALAPTMTASAPAASPQSAASNPSPGTAEESAAGPRTGFKSDAVPHTDAPNANGDVASSTPGGRTLESGPGYAIKVASQSSSSGSGAARAQRERSSKTNAAVERRHEPIICQGNRLLQIDNRNLEFDGDAVSAEDGCEIHITNSHITAKGVGISARAALVHIDNSQIEGDSASIDASNGAQVYASSSRFKGLSRRLDTSSFHDMGGNVWN